MKRVLLKTRRTFFFATLLFAAINIGAQNQLLTVGDYGNKKNEATLVSNNSEITTIQFNLNEIELVEVETDEGKAFLVASSKAPAMMETGSPSLFYLTSSIALPPTGNTIAEITYGQFTDYENIEIAPSKGNLTRNINPQSIPYTKGNVYQVNEFYPGTLGNLREPFIVRDMRGQSIDVFPVQYNPVTKVLRIYSEITVSVKSTDEQGINEINNSKKSRSEIKEFNGIYNNLFLNYTSSSKSYPLGEDGDLLIICFDDFMNEMQPYVDWKRTIGRKTTIIPRSEAGTTATTIKTYITNFYNNEENNLAYVLLVGDAAQIPVYATSSGDSDNWYGYIEGNDSFSEVFIGRFSAENVTHVATQVQRTIHYERDINTSDTWLSTGMGIARNEGLGGGHNGGEADYQHMDIIRDLLLDYTYDYIHKEYDADYPYTDPVPGVPPTNAAQISQHINEGVSIINYCNHGNNDRWSVANYNNTHVNALTNTGELPYIFSVACLVGNFKNRTCFAETWLRASHNGEPTGAVAAFMSTVNQSWLSPMTGQDEMNLILTENNADISARTFAGVAINGSMKMLSIHGNFSAREDHETWTVFGDPTLMLRTSVPQEMEILHDAILIFGSSSYSVNCDTEGAIVTLSYIDEESNEVQILGSATTSNGVAEIVFAEPFTEFAPVTLSIIAHNKVTYLTVLETSPPEPYIILKSFNLDANPDYGSNVGISIELTNMSIAPYTASSVKVEVTTDNEYVTIIDSSAGIEEITPREASFTNFDIIIDRNIPDQDSIKFVLNITGNYDENEYSWTREFNILANAPVVEIENIEIVNGEKSSGELNQLLVRLHNTGHAKSPVIDMAVSTSSEYLTFETSTENIEYIEAGEIVDLYFNLAVNENTPGGAHAELIVRLFSDIVSTFETQSIFVGNIPELSMENKSVTTSSTLFYDSGGAYANYFNRDDITMTFYPVTHGKKIQVSFEMFDTEEGADYLSIHDGSDASGEIVARYSGAGLPPDYMATNKEGALTFKFKSDATQRMSGWKAFITEQAKYNNISFSILDGDNDNMPAADAIITLNGVKFPAGYYTLPLIENGEHSYSIEKEGFSTITGIVTVEDEDVLKTVTFSTTIIDTNFTEEPAIYPNPFTDELFIGGNFDIAEIIFTSTTGQKIKEVKLNGNKSISTPDLNRGVYIVTIKYTDGKYAVRKVIKK